MTDLQKIQTAMAEAVSRIGKKDADGYGTCFQTALEAFCYAQTKNARLVHASCCLGGSNIGVTHAYIEVEGHVVDLDGTYSLRDWTAITRPKRIHRYTWEEAGSKALRTDSCGPWSRDLLEQHDKQHALLDLLRGQHA